MARRFDRELMRDCAAVRQKALSCLDASGLLVNQGNRGNSDLTSASRDLEALGEEYDRLAQTIGEIDEADSLVSFACALRISANFCLWADGTLGARPDTARFLTAAQAAAQLVLGQRNTAISEGTSPTASQYSKAALESWFERASDISQIGEVTPLLQQLERIRLPVFYSKGSLRSRTRRNSPSEEEEEDIEHPIAVVKLSLSLDGQPLGSPQAIRSGVQYGLEIGVEIAKWPEQYPELHLDFLSTMDPRDYSLPNIQLNRENGNRQALPSHCVLYRPQSMLSEPAIFRARGRFTEVRDPAIGSQSIPATMVGHSEVKLRALDETAHPVLSGYPTIDIQIPAILEEIRATLPQLGPVDLADFSRCFVHLSRYAGMVMQSGEFKGCTVSERDFQSHLLRNLRMTELSAEVREGERTSGGILDLRYRNIVMELKVETKISDRARLRAAYIEQPSQYTAHAIPLSIACILDMTEKVQPPANVANNITLETPAVHGFADGEAKFPSKVVVIIIDGNVKSPSHYS